ncbi:Hypothetical protein SMAX5B_011438, partial [Scophthalmus maximus]
MGLDVFFIDVCSGAAQMVKGVFPVDNLELLTESRLNEGDFGQPVVLDYVAT